MADGNHFRASDWPVRTPLTGLLALIGPGGTPRPVTTLCARAAGPGPPSQLARTLSRAG